MKDSIDLKVGDEIEVWFVGQSATPSGVALRYAELSHLSRVIVAATYGDGKFAIGWKTKPNKSGGYYWNTADIDRARYGGCVAVYNVALTKEYIANRSKSITSPNLKCSHCNTIVPHLSETTKEYVCVICDLKLLMRIENEKV
jgi:hypothetical protein